MKIEHTAMYVADLESAKDFFVKYFGGRANDIYHNHKTGFRSYFITFDEGARLELMNKPNVTSIDNFAEHTGYAHIAFSVGSKEKVDELTERLRNEGYSIISEPRTTGDGYYESCVLDIEGNRVEITV